MAIFVGMYYGIGTIESDDDIKKRWKQGPPDETPNYKGNHRLSGRNRFRFRLPHYLRNMGNHRCVAA
jgi:hypothetical protein